MKLNEIKQYKTDIDSEDAVWKLLNKHCSDALGKLPIVRGMNPFANGYGILHGAAGERVSQNTSNHYTVILDKVLPKEFPRRSKSIICANWQNRRYVRNYGITHAIIPYNDVTIGVCPGKDIFGTEISLSKHERARNMVIQRWNDWYESNDISDESYAKLISDFKKMLERRDFWDLDPKTIEKVIAEAYTKPFKLATTATDEIYNDGDNHELWIGGKCIAIQLELYRSVMRNKGVNK